MAENYEGEAIGYPAEVELDTVETPSPNYVVTLNSLAGAPRLVDEDGVDLETDDDAGTITVPGFVAGGAVRVNGSDVLISPTAAELVAANPELGGGAAEAVLAGPWSISALITQHPYPTLTASNHVVVTVTGNETTNGTNLATAYTAAKLLTPGGGALSATNRAYVVLPEGSYLRTTSLNIDTNFVDFIAETPVNPIHPDYLPRDTDFWSETISSSAFYRPTSTVVKTTTPAIHLFNQTANDVRLMGFTLAQLATTESAGNAASALFLPSTDYSASYYGQMVIWSNFNVWHSSHTQDPSSVADRVSVAARNSIRGTWVDCFANGAAWRARWFEGDLEPVYDAKHLRCWSNSHAFDNTNHTNGIDGAIFWDCHCKGAPESVAINLALSGFGCFAGVGGELRASTLFAFCSAGDDSFGCTIGNDPSLADIHPEVGATFYFCKGGDRCFAGSPTSEGYQQPIFTGVAIGIIGGDYCCGGGSTFIASLAVPEYPGGGFYRGLVIGSQLGKGSCASSDGATVPVGQAAGRVLNSVITETTWPAPIGIGEVINSTDSSGAAVSRTANSGVTAYTGGTASALDFIPTKNLAVGLLVWFVHASDGLKCYQLTAGSTAESAPSVIRPDDFEAAAVAATGTLTSDNTNVSNNATVLIGNKIYTFKTALTPTEGEVLIGADADASLLNLIRAINHTGTPGTHYQCAAAHTQVSAASSVTAHSFAVTALTAGEDGNSIATADSSIRLSWSSNTLTGGLDANTKIWISRF